MPPGRMSLVTGMLAVAASVGVLLTLAGPVAAAPPFTVNSTLDEPDAVLDGNCVSTPSGLCTLRAAVQEVAFAGSGTITVPAGVYVLTRPLGAGPDTASIGDLDISASTTITGAGAKSTIIDGNGEHRIFDVHAAGVASISGVSIRNGLGDLDPLTGHRHGGAIHNHGTLSLTDSTVSGSHSTAPGWGGGGITNAGTGTAVLKNVTIAANVTDGNGGGIENLGSLKLFNVTVTQNTAPASQGGGIRNSAGTSRLNNTIVAANTGGDCAGTITSVGNNLAGDASCAFAGPGDLNSTNPLLDPVPNDAGSIFVYALMVGSPAIDAGSGPYDGGTDIGCMPTDERGVTRPQDGNADGIPVCDIGAYEVAPGHITVTKKLVPSWDPGRFNLRIDGTTYASNVGNNGTTGPVAVVAGSHTVSEALGANALPGRYVTTISCSDGSFGVGTSLSGVDVGEGGSVTCTITNTRRLYKV